MYISVGSDDNKQQRYVWNTNTVVFTFIILVLYYISIMLHKKLLEDSKAIVQIFCENLLTLLYNKTI
jgi:hypothetical protein